VCDKGFASALLCTLLIAVTAAAAVQRPVELNGRNEGTVIKPADYYRRAEEARQLVRAGRHERAAELLEVLIRANPADGDNWLMLGSARFALKQYRAAVEPYTKAVELGFLDTAQGAYQLARCYSLLGEKEPALLWLERSLQAGYRYKSRLERDEQLKSLRADPRFLRLLGRAGVTAAARVDGWRGDLDYLVAEIKRVHSRYRREPLPAEFVRAADETRRAIPRLADEEVVVKFQRLLALLGDGHSLTYPFAMKLGALRRLPLSFTSSPTASTSSTPRIICEH